MTVSGVLLPQVREFLDVPELKMGEVNVNDATMSDDLAARDRALTRAVAAWGEMRDAMERAQPQTSHDCWWMVGSALCQIARSIENARLAKQKETSDGR